MNTDQIIEHLDFRADESGSIAEYSPRPCGNCGKMREFYQTDIATLNLGTTNQKDVEVCGSGFGCDLGRDAQMNKYDWQKVTSRHNWISNHNSFAIHWMNKIHANEKAGTSLLRTAVY